MPFRVLFVCTGNVCRSPAAQLLFAGYAAGNDIACASAGTTGLTGRGVDEPTALALRDIGADPDGHRARRLTPGLVTAADLVLTATVDHRAALVRESPLAFRKVFTVREFARLGADLAALGGSPPPEQLVARVLEVAQQRGQVDLPEGWSDDIGDPFGAGVDVARGTVEEVRQAVGGVVRALGLALPDLDPFRPSEPESTAPVA